MADNPDFGNSGVGQPKLTCDPKNPPECYIKFRPKSDWNGEYGFDWNREGDCLLTPPGGSPLTNLNIKFDGNVGYHMTTDATGQQVAVNMDMNYGGNSLTTPFTPSDILYQLLQTCYYTTTEVTVNNATVDMYMAYLSIYQKEDNSQKPDADIVANVYINTAQPPPDEIVLDYDTTLLAVTPAITVGGTLDSPSTQPINVKVLSTFATDQTIVVKAKQTAEDGTPNFTVMGNLTVVANAKANRRVQNVLLVTVQTPPFTAGTPAAPGALMAGEKDLFTNVLRQALVDPAMQGDVINLDISTDTSFVNMYTQLDTVANAQTVILWGGTNNVVPYLNQKLAAQLTAAGDARAASVTDPTYKIAYYWGVPIGGVYPTAPTIRAYGGLQLPGTITFMMGPTRYTNCLAHEMLHSLGLPHTFVPMQFSGNALYTYKYGMTDNIMDYSNNANGAGYEMAGNNLYKWQWFIAQSNSTPEP